MKNQTPDLMQVYKDRISSQRWDWAFSVFFPKKTSKRKTLEEFARWIKFVRDSEGACDFRWVRFLHIDADGKTPHLHVLIGGVKTLNGFIDPWLRWTRRVNAKVFMPNEKAANFISKFFRPDIGPDAVDCFGINGELDAKE